MTEQGTITIQDHHLNKFVDFALKYFEDEKHKKEYESWHLERYGYLPDKAIKAGSNYE